MTNRLRDNPGQAKEGSTVADIVSCSIKVVSPAGVAEAKSRGWPLAGAARSTRWG